MTYWLELVKVFETGGSLISQAEAASAKIVNSNVVVYRSGREKPTVNTRFSV